MNMKRILTLTVSLVLSAQVTFSQKIRIKVTGQKDTTVHLIKYFGKGLYYADTAQLKNGEVIFNGSKQKPGILGLLLPGQQYFEFIFNNEELWLETAGSNGAEFTKNLVYSINEIFSTSVGWTEILDLKIKSKTLNFSFFVGIKV